ncbi:hypothetical protein GOV03_02605 [Candidatus Woesearchaeota archaeon]|nr:hypothetical protein [Candidatus Woesearchaeota archaeon]
MMNDKKGLMVKFLTTIILAIIIFVPACLFVSKAFGATVQAKDNFGEFVREIKEFSATSKDGEVSSFMLIMDTKSFIVLFDEKEKRQLVGSSIEGDSSCPEGFCSEDAYNKNYFFTYPKTCGEEACVCLCREFEEGEEILIKVPNPLDEIKSFDYETEYICKTLHCEGLPEVVLKEGWGITRNKDDLRRTAIQFKKESNQVEVGSQSS